MTDSELVAVLRRIPTVANLIYEIESWDAHKDDPPFIRSHEEIMAAFDKANRWRFW